MTRLGLLVTDASPLITLAAAGALDCLIMTGLPVSIPDMVYHEVARDLLRLGATEVVEWVRRHPNEVRITPSTVYAEFSLLLSLSPATRSRGRGEAAVLEIANAEIERDPSVGVLLLYEDNDIRTARFTRELPSQGIVVSTGDLLRALEAAGRIQSSDRVLDAAAERARNAERQRHPADDGSARDALLRHLRALPRGE